MAESRISHIFDNNLCKINISTRERTKNYKNCDIFINENDFIFCMDNSLEKLQSPRKFDVKDIKNLEINFDSKTKEYSCVLPCFPEEPKPDANKIVTEKGALEKRDEFKENFDILKLKRITDSCVLIVDNETCKFIENFGFGFGSRFHEHSHSIEAALYRISRIVNPLQLSPLSRSIQRERDELEDFCRDQYKLNFVELQVPEGHENPMKFIINFDDCKFTQSEEALLQTLRTKKPEVDIDDRQTEIDCGLVSILLAICYDIRSTLNDATCESAWTRTILSPAFQYFEVHENIKTVVECFLRRSLIYPLYRNYEFSRRCVEDAIEGLHRGTKWIQKQFLATHELFLTSEDSRQTFNTFFMEDYLKYLSNVVDDGHLHMLSRNLKNVLLDVTKKNLRLGLGEIETELLKELIQDIHLGNSSDSDDLIDEGTDSERDDEATTTDEGSEEEADDDGTTSSSSDDDGNNSVIENKA